MRRLRGGDEERRLDDHMMHSWNWSNGTNGMRRLRGGDEERRLDDHMMHSWNWSNGTNGTNGSGAYAMLPPEEPTTTSTTTTPYPGRRFPAMCFFSLGVEQQMAIHALGYTINTWNCF